jgi:hypothetical protein
MSAKKLRLEQMSAVIYVTTKVLQQKNCKTEMLEQNVRSKSQKKLKEKVWVRTK